MRDGALGRFAREQWPAFGICNDVLLDDFFGKPVRHPPEKVHAAVGEVFAFIQRELALIGKGERLEGKLKEALWVAQSDAAKAFRLSVGTAGEAKRLQAAAAGGTPLTVCVGRRLRRLPQDIGDQLDPLGEVEEYRIPTLTWIRNGDGCGIVMPDEDRSRFRWYCNRCRKRTSELKDKAIRNVIAGWEVRRFRIVGRDQLGNRVDGWKVRCDKCQQWFFARVLQARTCPQCGHRRR
jgi:hypothetical protein